MANPLIASDGYNSDASGLQVSENELWLLSYYRESELAGALLMGRLARETDDDDLRVRLTEHCAEEARHAWAWTETILRVGGTPRRVSETYQSRYHAAVGNPSNLLEVLALTQIFERRVVRHFKAHLAWPGTHPEVARTLQQLIDEEVGHIRWVKDRLDAYGAIHGELVVREMLDRFQRIDEQVYNGLRQYAECFELVAGPKKGATDSIENRLRRVAAESLGREPSGIRLDASLAELGVDSLDLVVFMMAVEDEFSVEFSREDQKSLKSLGDLVAKLRLIQDRDASEAHRIPRQGAVGELR
ncbi:MAG TPA: phosphopantetheine-binding protein [Gemmatimonadaceae bacterium]|nr:phosphopantetheine-binding protein [Gemmatimonadaceae bacterium]